MINKVFEINEKFRFISLSDFYNLKAAKLNLPVTVTIVDVIGLIKDPAKIKRMLSTVVCDK
jgi:hypothetical protein